MRLSFPEGDTHGTPKTREVGQDDGLHETVRSLGTQPELPRPGKGTKRMPNRVCACGAPENLNLSGLGPEKCMKLQVPLDSASWVEHPIA